MIERLLIKNYLIIKEVEIDFSDGLNILTGETGAGKSIIIDALSLILGERADYSLIKKDEERLIVEGYCRLKDDSKVKKTLKQILDDGSMDNNFIILRREILKKGISRNFINDVPANISDMKKLGDAIVDIHSQNEHQSLLNRDTYIETLDNYIGNPKILSKYRNAFAELKENVRNFEEMSAKKEELLSKRGFLDFQLKEINNLNLAKGEDILLETELNKLENIESISLSINNSLKILYEDESNAQYFISVAIKELRKVSEFDKNLEKIIEDLESSCLLVKESSESLNRYRQQLDFDNVKIEQIRERLSNVNQLKKKYGLTIDELISKAELIEKELSFAENFDYEIETLLKKIKSNSETAYGIAKEITGLRIKKSKELEKSINSLFKEVGLESAEFKVEIKNISGEPDNMFCYKESKDFLKLGESGFNEIEFLVKTNKGMDFSPLRKSASGGEVSRIMLSIKTALAKRDNIPVLVFDEIDAGISGRIAQKVGKVLKKLAGSHQIICITHLPQIAAMSDKHFHVSKQEKNNETTAKIDVLDNDEKVIEVAKLISGENVTDTAKKTTIELING